MTIKFNKKLFIALMVVAFLAPQAMSAQTGFCNNLDKFLTNGEGKLSARQADKDVKMTQRQAELVSKRAENDKKLADLRDQVMTRQDERFDKISQKITSPEQQAAFEEFKTGVKNAVSVRQAAVDAARNAHRVDLDKLIADRKTSIDNATSAMKASIESAVAKAKADCANKIAPATVKTELQNSIKSARQTFKTTVQGLQTIGEQNKVLVQARQAAFEKAKNDFKNTVESLKATLKSKLGNQ